VGYGDFGVTTESEYWLAIFWMIVGTNFFSFTIGSVTTLIAVMDEEQRAGDQKLELLRSYGIKHNIPKNIIHNC